MAADAYRLGAFDVDLSAGGLRRDGREIRLRKKTLDVLGYLLKRPGLVVSKHELIDALWPDTAVTDDTLVQSIRELRQVLEDDHRHPEYIQTVPKFGYRLIAPVRALAVERQAVDSATEEATAAVDLARDLPQPTRVRPIVSGWTVVGVAALVLFAVLGVGAMLSGWSRPAVAATPPSRVTVAVTMFGNQSARSDLDWLSAGVPDMLIAGLARSRVVSVVSPTQLDTVRKRLGQPSSAPTDLAGALALARGVGSQRVVLGSFKILGEAIRVDARIHDVPSGALLAAESLTVEELPRLLRDIDLFAIRLAARIGGASSDTPAQPVAEPLTDSVEAYRLYVLAMEQANAYHSAEALDLLERAIALDPRFAMAYARIGYVHMFVRVRDLDAARPYLEKALTLSNRLSPRDALYVKAWSVHSRGDEAGVTRLLRDIVDAYPDDVEGYWRLGRQLAETHGQIEDAIDVYSRGLALDPYAHDIWNAIGFLHNAVGQYDRAIAAHERYVSLKPEEPNAYDSLAMSYLQAGRFDEAQATLDRADALNPRFHFAALHRGDLYVMRGRYRDALNAYGRYLQLAPSDWDRAVANGRLAALYLRLGQLDRAEEAAANERQLHHDFGTGIEVALVRGNLGRAQTLAAAYFAPGDKDSDRLSNRKPEHLRGLLALRTGRPADALAAFQRVIEIKGREWGLMSVEDCLAQAHADLGRWDGAIQEYRRILALNPADALSHFRLASVYERAGRPGDARQAYKRFLALWPEADRDIVEVLGARKALAAAPSSTVADGR